MTTTSLPYNSLFVSGFAVLLFNIVFFQVCKYLAQAICSHYNLHIIYDRNEEVSPRESLIGKLFGGPTGPIHLTRWLSVMVMVFSISVILLDFSINGATETKDTPTRFQSVVRVNPDSKPLEIDYENEFGAVDESVNWSYASGLEYEKRRVSRRLIATLYLQICLDINLTHHTTFAYAYDTQPLDKEKLPVGEWVGNGAKCVRAGEFAEDMVSFSYNLESYPSVACEVLTMTGSNYKGAIGEGNVSVGNDCELGFHDISCFRLRTEHCAAIVYKKNDPTIEWTMYVPNTSVPENMKMFPLRIATRVAPEDRKAFAANVAFLQATGVSSWGSHNAMYHALAKIEEGRMLPVRTEHNVTQLQLELFIPVMVIISVILIGLLVATIATWISFVFQKKRMKYVSFFSVRDTLQMVQKNGLHKKRSEKNTTKFIYLHEDRPVISYDEPKNSTVTERQVPC